MLAIMRSAARCRAAAPRYAGSRLGNLTRKISSLHMQPITAANQKAVDAYDNAVSQYLSLSGNPVKELEAAVAADPDCLMAHALIGMLYCLSTGFLPSHPTLADALKKTHDLVLKGVGTRREQAFVAALHAYAHGHLRRAANILDSALVWSPTDALLVRAVHDMHFFNGDSVNLRNSVARVFRQWDVTMPEYAKICGMLAFGLEENNQYGEAEEYGMQAINMDPSDAWALHAVTHVYEMQARVNEGRRLLKETSEHWEHNALLKHHILWHSCLFEIEDGEHVNALGRYDANMTGEEYAPVLNVADSAALMWRFELASQPAAAPFLRPVRVSEPLSASYIQAIGVPLEVDGAPWRPKGVEHPTRWTEIARRFQPYLGQHIMAFNDVHAVMALAAAGDSIGARAQLESMKAYANAVPGASHSTAQELSDLLLRSSGTAGPLPDTAASSLLNTILAASRSPVPSHSPFGFLASHAHFAKLPADNASPYRQYDNRFVTRVAGIPLAEGMQAFWAGDYSTATARLLESRPLWPLVGGSHAQRDVFMQTLVHAALYAGYGDLARNLVSEMVTLKFGSARLWSMYGNVLDTVGETAHAADARNRAYALGLGQGGPVY